MTWPAPGEGGGMSGASHIDGANPIGRVKNGNGQLSTERQDRMMVDAWSVDRDATSSFCVFALPAIFHSRTGAEVRSRLQLCEREERSTVQGPRPGIRAGNRGTDTEFPIRQAVARREEKGFIRRTAETPTEPARAPVGCMPRPDPRRLRTNANQ